MTAMRSAIGGWVSSELPGVILFRFLDRVRGLCGPGLDAQGIELGGTRGEQTIEAAEEVVGGRRQIRPPAEPDEVAQVVVPVRGDDGDLPQRGLGIGPPGDLHHEAVGLTLLAATHRQRQ